MSNWREDTPYDREELPDHKEEKDHKKYMSGYILTKIIKLCIRQVENKLVNMKIKR